MKRILFIAVFLPLSVLVLSAKKESKGIEISENYIINEGHLYWQHVFESDMSTADVMEFFKNHDWCGMMKITWQSSDSGSLLGTHLRPLDYKKYEVNVFGTPMYLMSTPCEYSVQVDFKDGKYRVTISNIRFDNAELHNVVNQKLTGATGTVTESWTNIEEYAFEDDGYKSNFRKNTAIILDNMWLDEYTAKAKEKNVTNDEW